MLPIEAVRLSHILLARPHISPLLNLGSADRGFREVTQPHIARDLFEPLKRAGIDVFHSDLKDMIGVDLAGDIADPAVRGALKARRFKCILLANLLEHVRDREAVAAACEDIVGPGGLILATVPRSYPYHADPRDFYYRPSPAELAGTFKHSRPILVEELVGPTYAEDLRIRGSTVWKELAKTILSLPIALARPRTLVARAHRWLWYRRPYRVSIALLAVAGGTDPNPSGT